MYKNWTFALKNMKERVRGKEETNALGLFGWKGGNKRGW